MSIEYIAKSARRVHAEHSQISKILKHLCSSCLLVAFYLFIYSFIIINYYYLVEKSLLNTENDSKQSLYKTLMGDIISYLKKSKQYFVCTMGLKLYTDP